MDNRMSYDRSNREQWNKKIAAMKRRKRRARIRQWLITAFALIGLIAGIGSIVVVSRMNKDKKAKEEEAQQVEKAGITVPIADVETEPVVEEEPEGPEPPEGMGSIAETVYSYSEAEDIAFLGGDNMQSNKAILVDADNGIIIGSRDYKARIVPASMTKVLTVLVAAEHVTDPTAEVTVTIEATDYAYTHDCSTVGFARDEKVTVEDLFYGTILSSGGDAAAQLAMYVAGTQEAFVDMMNEKLQILGISGTTHFTNTVGIYDNDHYSTCHDMAVIMNAAMDNEYCRKILSAHTYTTSKTIEHPEGILISNWFLRRIEDKETGGEVIGAKTGYVMQSGNCGVSYFTSDDGKNYICVTADAHSAWRCIYDHVDIYLHNT